MVRTPVFLALAALAIPVVLPSSARGADAPFAMYLDTEAIGAAAFRRAHPQWDGRGVAVAVLDTGVDMGVPGLQKTPGGEVKVVEARDFTGESVVDCNGPSVEKDEQGRAVWRTQAGWVQGVDRNPAIPANTPVYLGFLEESRFRNSAVADLNRNGRSDDRFAVVLFAGADGEWRAVLDRNGDHDVAGDPVVRSYSKSREFLRFAGHDASREVPSVAIALNIEASGDGPKKVEFHVPAGSHGTHVAGIAAGFRLNGQDGYDGVAPGAVVLSLKVGDNSLAGGASVTDSMRKAFEFAGRWAREHRMPLVVNMSYGVPSEVEGQGDMDRFVDRFVEENPQVVVVLSAGNDGPGLSTVGSPAASMHAVSVAAAYTPAIARDLLGASIPGPRLFQFSARGGEVGKPDVAAPGIASSTVPYWERHDVMRGTSMAAPQVAGAAALMLSGLVAADREAPWNVGMVKRALRGTARPIAGYGPLDAGAGLVDVSAAFEALRREVADPDARLVLGFEVQTPVSTLGGRRGQASFWRAGGWAPDKAAAVEVSVKARFLAGAPGQAKADWYRSFSLSADASWVKLSKGSVYLKGDEAATFELWVDRDAVAKPGVHVATVSGKAGSLRFSFPVTVVTPYRVEAKAGALPEVRLRGLRLEPADLVRIPFSPPAGTSVTQLTVKASDDRFASVFAYLYDGQGHRVPLESGTVSTQKGESATAALDPADVLEPGTYELVLYAPPTSREASTVDAVVRFPALDAAPVDSLKGDPGLPPRANLAVTNRLDAPFIGSVRGVLAGYERSFTRTLGGDSLREGFHVSREYEGVEIELTMSPEDYGRFTDLSVNVLDRDGKALTRGGFPSRRVRITFRNPDPAREGDFFLEVRGGRARGGGPPVNLSVAMRYLWRDKVTLTGTVAGQQRVQLYPTVRTSIELRASATPKAPPAGAVHWGWVELLSARDGSSWARVPVRAR